MRLRARWLVLLAVVLFVPAAAASGPVSAAAPRARPETSTRRSAARRRAAPSPERRQELAAFVRRYLNPNRAAVSGLSDGAPRVRLTRTGGLSEDFTVSNRRFLLRGRVWDAGSGVGGRVDEAFEKIDGRWTRSENPWE